MDKSLGKFDVIFGGNLIDRLYDPELFINSLPQFMNKKALLVLTSPYTWLKEYTPEEKWIGGKVINGKNVSTYDSLKQMLAKVGIKEVRSPDDIRFVIKENNWVYQYTLAHVTYWIK